MSSCYTHDPYARLGANHATVQPEATPTRVVQIASPSAMAHGTVCYYYYSNVRSTPLVVKAVCMGSPASTTPLRDGCVCDVQGGQATHCPAPQLQLTQPPQQGSATTLFGHVAATPTVTQPQHARAQEAPVKDTRTSLLAQGVAAEGVTTTVTAERKSISSLGPPFSSSFAASDSVNTALSSRTRYYCGLSTAEDGMCTPRQQCVSPPVSATHMRVARNSTSSSNEDVMECDMHDGWLTCVEPAAWLASSGTAQSHADELYTAGRCCTPSPCRVQREEESMAAIEMYDAKQPTFFPQALLPSHAVQLHMANKEDESETYAGPQEEDAAVQEATTWVELLLRYRDRENDIALTASNDGSEEEDRQSSLPLAAVTSSAAQNDYLCCDVVRRVRDTLATFAAQRTRQVEALWQRSTFHPLYTDR